jgi:hypothetical protein
MGHYNIGAERNGQCQTSSEIACTIEMAHRPAKWIAEPWRGNDENGTTLNRIQGIGWRRIGWRYALQLEPDNIRRAAQFP